MTGQVLVARRAQFENAVWKVNEKFACYAAFLLPKWLLSHRTLCHQSHLNVRHSFALAAWLHALSLSSSVCSMQHLSIEWTNEISGCFGSSLSKNDRGLTSATRSKHEATMASMVLTGQPRLMQATACVWLIQMSSKPDASRDRATCFKSLTAWIA